MKYEFQLVYVPGKDLVVPDVLSRELPTGLPSGMELTDIEVHALEVQHSLVSEATKPQLVRETARDTALADVNNCLRETRPVQGQLKPFAGGFTEVAGVLFKGAKVIIPDTMRKPILERIHEGHLGINKCKAQERDCYFSGRALVTSRR